MDATAPKPMGIEKVRKGRSTSTLTDTSILFPAIWQSVVKLNPRHMIGNPDVAQALVTAMQSVAAGKLDPKAALEQVNSVAVAQQGK